MKWIPVLLSLGYCFFSCGNQLQQQESVHRSITETIRDSLNGGYDATAIKVLSNGDVLDGLEQIQDYSLSNPLKNISLMVDTLILAHEQRAITYEISERIYENGDNHKALVIWQAKSAQNLRVFEFSAKINPSNIDLTEIDRRRAQWIELCKQNDAQKLIQELYTENTLYYNHKPLVEGRERLVNEYQYMNNENYSLTLSPIIVEPVNQNFVLEISQCAGSYNGKYILIWRKEKDGQWRIFIDSNI